jgi:hypothetical protein
MRRFAAALGNAFLLAFALDAGLSVADEITRLACGSEVLAPARNLAALLALGLAPALAACLPFAPGLPLAAFLPALVFLAWSLFGAMPLPLWSSAAHAGLALAALQVGLALLAALVVRRRSRSGVCWLLAGDLAAAPFRPLRAFGLLAAAGLLVPAALGGYLAFSIAAALEHATHGFVRFDRDGIAAMEREYSRGDRRVRLVGLVHVGEGEAYRELVSSFEHGDLILAEGVSDRDGLLREGLPYGNVARPLGLVVQPSFEEALAGAEGVDADAVSGPRVVRADLDLRDLSPETLAFLRAVSGVLASADFATALARARELSKEFDTERSTRILRDLIERRNAHLVGELDKALPEHPSIVVPWGALHLPGIERALVERGFERTGEHGLHLVRYATLARALSEQRWSARSGSGRP